MPLSRPTSLSTSPPVLPKLAVTPALSIPQPTDIKDSTCHDTKQDSSVVQVDNLQEILAGTPEGLLLNDLKAAPFRYVKKPCSNITTALLTEYKVKKGCVWQRK